ncbi:MAG TPA: hypothetical protein VFQ89_13360, partial [Candidatus Binatia bacterium]|nr:hypothetical protein [Candidatus Binatia bacterium]
TLKKNSADPVPAAVKLENNPAAVLNSRVECIGFHLYHIAALTNVCSTRSGADALMPRKCFGASLKNLSNFK